MEKKNKKVNLNKNNIDNHKIFTAKRGKICIIEKKVRILFFDYLPGKKPNISENRHNSVIIEMTKSNWLNLINIMTLKTVESLMQIKCKDSGEIQENTEVMFR